MPSGAHEHYVATSIQPASAPAPAVRTPLPPSPWTVGERPTPRSMFPIRDANQKIVCYVPNADVAAWICQAGVWLHMSIENANR